MGFDEPVSRMLDPFEPSVHPKAPHDTDGNTLLCPEADPEGSETSP